MDEQVCGRKEQVAAIGSRTFAVMVVVAVTAGSAAGIGLGIVFAVAVDRARKAFEPIDWAGADDDE